MLKANKNFQKFLKGTGQLDKIAEHSVKSTGTTDNNKYNY